MMAATGNIFEHVLSDAVDEELMELLALDGVRIERIVSTGQASPPGFWYDQAWSEWVLVVSGSAGLLFEDEPTPRALTRGDYLLIPAGKRHRVEWTDATEPTIWLAVHFGSTTLNREAGAETVASGSSLRASPFAPDNATKAYAP
jgi:cupin 2 domain-containing protein